VVIALRRLVQQERRVLSRLLDAAYRDSRQNSLALSNQFVKLRSASASRSSAFSALGLASEKRRLSWRRTPSLTISPKKY
jgi:hypothetical protein